MDSATGTSALRPPAAAASGSWPVTRASVDDAWAERRGPRRARLVAGAAVAAAVFAGFTAGLAALPAPAAPSTPEEEPIEVALVEAPEEPPPPPEPEPVAATAEAAAAPAPGPRRVQVATPTAVPDGPPPETDPGADPYRGDPGPPAEGPAGGGGPPASTGTGVARPAAPPPPAAAPKAAGPVRVTDDVEPPKPLSMASPPYPAAAKAAGVEGTVVVAYVVTESGAVEGARVVRGPPELAESCLAAVRGWRFTPAMAGGRPVAVKRSARFPFRLRT